jgi:hypothetical protein
MSSTAAAATSETRTRKRLPAARPAREALLRMGRERFISADIAGSSGLVTARLI